MKKEEKKYGLLKGVLVLILVAIFLSWVFPVGEYSGTVLQEAGMQRIGLGDLGWIIFYAIDIALDKIIFLLAVGGLYGVLSKINAYERLVDSLAKKFSKHKKATVVILSTLIAVLTSMLTQSFALLIFIPFIIAILKRMKLDKMEILATTFGAILVGVLGATYGTEGLIVFDDARYMGGINNASVFVRAGVLIIGLVLFNFFTLTHMDKTGKKTEPKEMFEIETSVEEKKKSSIIPLVVISVFMFIILILGFINWSGAFGISVFDNFHEYLTEKVVIGKDFYVLKDILGIRMKAFGSWDLSILTGVVFLFNIILGLCYKVKFKDFVASFTEGLKTMLKPVLVVVGAYTLFVVVYMSPYIATIGNKILGLTKGFNLVTTIITAIIASIFHTDLGFTGYTFASYLLSSYASNINVVYVIFTTMYGFVQFFIPTSVILGVGLIALDVKYKDWLKYIWKFLLGMLVCLVVIFILMTLI